MRCVIPFQSKSQVRAFFAKEKDGELPKGTAKRWAHHTKDIKGLPEKKAFVASFLLRCAKAGKTTPAEIAVEAEKYAAEMEKRASTGGDILSSMGDAAGRVTGFGALGATLGLAAPLGIGYLGGQLTGVARNQIDTDDAESLRVAALANAYRRRAAEAKMQSQVRDLVSSNPGQYAVVG